MPNGIKVYRILFFSILGFAVVMIGRLWWLQGWQGRFWQAAADTNRTVKVVERAPRGQILDRQGKIVADNQLLYTQVFTENNQKKERIISQEEALYFLATAPAELRKNYVRHYPYGPILSHVLGYIQKPQYSSDVVFGRTGLEQEQNSQLSGKDGVTVYERNALGKPTRILQRREPEIGRSLTLSLDAELSQVAFEALGNQKGAVIVSLPQTGEVLVLVSKPSFVPTDFPEDKEKWQAEIEQGSVSPSLGEALKDKNNPLLFRPLVGQYPPGSIYKIVTALAGLERQVITTSTVVHDEGELKVGEFTYQNWYWRQFGRVEGDVNIVRALARSNDIFFYRLAEWIGPDQLAEFSHWFSLGEKTGIDLNGEKAGLIPTPAWKQQRFGEKWYLGNTFHMGIGQGDVLVTPLQLQVLMSTVATQGRRCQPKIFPGNSSSCQEISLQAESWESVIQGLRQACSPGGTAYPFFETSYDVMCKTGTAEFGQENDEGHRPTHGWFSVAVSKKARQESDETTFTADMVITVLVESDDKQPYKEGSREAAPVAKIIADWWSQNR